MTGMDSCVYMVNVDGCGVPRITITDASGAFAHEEKKVMLHFVEGMGDAADHLTHETLYSD